jgi:hypothetical protein
MPDGPGEAHQVARFASVFVPGKKRTGRVAHEINCRQRVESRLREFPNLREIAAKWMTEDGVTNSWTILSRLDRLCGQAGFLTPFITLRQIRTARDSS